MKLTADRYCYLKYHCAFEEPAMFKPLSYFSVFVIIRQPLVPSTDTVIPVQMLCNTLTNCITNISCSGITARH